MGLFPLVLKGPKQPQKKVKFANSIDPDEVAHNDSIVMSSLIWIYTVCL